jgi:hypothetical protein
VTVAEAMLVSNHVHDLRRLTCVLAWRRAWSGRDCLCFSRGHRSWLARRDSVGSALRCLLLIQYMSQES